MNNFLFLKSTRFWVLFLLAGCVALNSYGVLPQETMNALITLLGGFIVVRTVDRATE